MPKFTVEWYIDYPGMDGIREMEIDAKDADEANKTAKERRQRCYSR
jgi:hypothetical protein